MTQRLGGHVELVVKVYKGIERFPDGGKMSQYLGALQVGDLMSLSGPWGMIEYKGQGLFMYGKKEIKARQIGLIAGGTGITPMLQIIKAATDCQVSLIFANQTEDDILVRSELEAVKGLKLWYTLDRPPPNWPYSSGFIDADMIHQHLPPPGDDTLILMCGPPPMIQYACKPNLDKLGYAKDRQLAF